MDGLILIDKERNWTSRDVCNVCQKKFNTKKVGHTGTLDPFATGLLVVTINKANKICQFLDDFPKTYIASLKLGEKTTTLDLTGEIIDSKNPSEHTKEEIIEVLNSFLGEIEQIPPMTSAIHYKGRKLYEYAHEGIDVEREARKVNIYDISLLDYQDDTIVFSATVSKGTYIRVLGEDIASKLNEFGHLKELRRTKIGNFDVKDGIKIGELNSDYPLINIGEALCFLKTYTVSGNMIKKVKDGVKLYLKDIEDDIIYVKDDLDNPLAIYVRRDDHFVSKRGLW